MATAHPDIPVIALKTVIQRKQELLAGLSIHRDIVLSGTRYDDFLEGLLEVLPGTILKKTLDDNFKYLLGSSLDAKSLDNLAWLIAGNVQSLVDKRVITLAKLDTIAWAAAQVIDTNIVKRGGPLMHMIQFKVLTGPLASQVTTQYWSFKKTSYLATYRNDRSLGFGFNRSRINSKGEQMHKLIFNDLRQFYGLRCFLLFDPSRSQDVPYVVEVGHSGGTMKYNRQLLELRDRAITGCFKQLNGDPECYRCPYGTDQCKFATHPKTYRKGSCTFCNRVSFFDPDDLSKCVDCLAKELKQ